MTSSERYFQVRIYMTLAIAASHGTLALLGIIGRLSYAVPSHYELLREVMTSDAWVWLHALAAIVLIASLIGRRQQVNALGFSAGVMGAWSFISLFWGLSTNIPVSLVSPVLGASVTALTYLLCASWARAEPKGR